jgi:hypothetical protein
MILMTGLRPKSHRANVSKGGKIRKVENAGGDGNQLATTAAGAGNVTSLISGDFNAQDIADIANTLLAFVTKAEERLTHFLCPYFALTFSIKF